MKKTSLFILILVFFIVAAGYVVFHLNSNSPQSEEIREALTSANNEVIENCTPTFRDGGGPYYKSNSPFREKIVPDVNNGERLIVSGKILRSDCKTPVSNAVLDIWQANETGNYEDEWYRGQVRTDDEGNYTFETVIPKGYGEGTGYRPPHIHFKVFEGNTELVTSQMFFPESKGTPGFEDAFIIQVESTEENGAPLHQGTHNIIIP